MKRAKERDSSETAAIKINRRKVCLLIIASGGRRVRENRGGSSCVSRPDPRKLSSEELADIRRRVQSGEKIRF